MDNDFYEIGAFYALHYEDMKKPDFVWRECIDIRDGWAVLYKMGTDYKGDPRPDTCVVPLSFREIKKRPYYQRLYLDEGVEIEMTTHANYLKFRILPDYAKADAKYIIEVDENFYMKNFEIKS